MSAVGFYKKHGKTRPITRALPPSLTPQRYVVWHVRDSEGFVDAVFVFPEESWVSESEKYAKEAGWEWIAGDSDASYYDDPSTGESVGSIERGVPAQPFSYIHVIGGPENNLTLSTDFFGGWHKVHGVL